MNTFLLLQEWLFVALHLSLAWEGGEGVWFSLSSQTAVISVVWGRWCTSLSLSWGGWLSLNWVQILNLCRELNPLARTRASSLTHKGLIPSPKSLYWFHAHWGFGFSSYQSLGAALFPTPKLPSWSSNCCALKNNFYFIPHFYMFVVGCSIHHTDQKYFFIFSIYCNYEKIYVYNLTGRDYKMKWFVMGL